MIKQYPLGPVIHFLPFHANSVYKK